jgi:hypothetical protein
MDDINFLTHRIDDTNCIISYMIDNPNRKKIDTDIAVLFNHKTDDIHRTMAIFRGLFKINSIFAYKKIGCILFKQKNFNKAKNDLKLRLDIDVLTYIKNSNFDQLVQIMIDYIQLGVIKIPIKLSSFKFDTTTEYPYEYIGYDPAVFQQKWNYATIFTEQHPHRNINNYWFNYDAAQIVSVFYFNLSYYHHHICVLSTKKIKSNMLSVIHTVHKRCLFKNLAIKILELHKKIDPSFSIGHSKNSDDSQMHFKKTSQIYPHTGYTYIGQDPFDVYNFSHISIFSEKEPGFNMCKYWHKYQTAKIYAAFYFDYCAYVCILSHDIIKTSDNHIYRALWDITKVVNLLHDPNIQDLFPKITDLPFESKQDRILKIADFSFESKHTRILNLKETKKYVNKNPSDVCHFVIVYVKSFDNKQNYSLFLDMFNVEIVDKIFTIDNFIITFLQNFDVFGTIKSKLLGHKRFQLCTDIDYMYSGLFDEKYEEVDILLQRIRKEKMLEREIMLKKEANEAILHNIEQSKSLVIQKNMDKILRNFDQNQLFVCDFYKSQGLVEVDVRIIENLCKNRTTITTILDEMVNRITKCLLKYLICGKKMIAFHPFIYYLCILTHLFDRLPKTAAVHVAYMTCNNSILHKLDIERREIVTFAKKNGIKSTEKIIDFKFINKYIGYPDTFDINVVSYYRFSYYDIDINNVKLNLPTKKTREKIKIQLNKYLNYSDGTCFKELLLCNFWSMLCSKSYESGMFQYLPREIIYIMIRNMISVSVSRF